MIDFLIGDYTVPLKKPPMTLTLYLKIVGNLKYDPTTYYDSVFYLPSNYKLLLKMLRNIFLQGLSNKF